MTKHTKLSVYAFITFTVSSIFLAGCVIHVGASDGSYDYDGKRGYNTTNKSVSVAKGLNVGEVSSVNGSVTLNDSVSAEAVSSVNGRISISDNVSVESVEIVNGRIKIGESFNSSGSIETVNGKISIDQNSVVGGSVETVNGDISLSGVTISNNVESVNGSIYLLEGTLVKGDVVFEGKPNKNNWKNSPPVLKLDANSDIQGNIIVYKEVEFDFANPALLNKVERRYTAQ